MKVIVSCAMSMDGFLDDTSSERLILSSEEDFYEVHKLRASCDGIFVGANTIRCDNPSLTTRNKRLIELRESQGINRDPVKVTVTQSGDLDISSKFFNEGRNEKIVFCPASVGKRLSKVFCDVATVIPINDDELNAKTMVSNLADRGFNRLLVEGGAKTLTMFFREGQVDELRLAVAPFFVGDMGGPRFVEPSSFPQSSKNRMKPISVKILGDTVVTYYSFDRR